MWHEFARKKWADEGFSPYSRERKKVNVNREKRAHVTYSSEAQSVLTRPTNVPVRGEVHLDLAVSSNEPERARSTVAFHFFTFT